ncbi:Duplicated homeodomain-like superfamily protein [Abeliophyllum distichum]|uniref:Duplicated homeodomain-like superfamily protein n=1 Tax=Abeliophyllum distichum TaxID=126358 RepID=A0ABD1SHC1_9LAMI
MDLYFSCNTFNENETSFIGSKIQPKNTDWSIEENNLFENAIGDHNLEFPYLFNKIASLVPGKTIEQINEHYEALMEDVHLIESGHVPLPNYIDIDHNNRKPELSAETSRRKSKQKQKMRKFLVGLEKYGKGNWRGISRNCVLTKSPAQVASHAQKYYIRLQKSG